MKTKITSLFLIIIGLTAIAQTSSWTIDKSHSKIQFDIAHMVISEVSGQFSDYSGSINTINKNFTDANIQFTIQVKSIDTDDKGRDEHLLKPDFLDAEKYPTITFKSKSFKNIEGKKYELRGDFTLHGITKEIVLEATYGGTVKDPWGNTKAGFKVIGVINRTDFGLKHDSVLDTGGLMIGEEVSITCRLELLKSK